MKLLTSDICAENAYKIAFFIKDGFCHAVRTMQCHMPVFGAENFYFLTQAQAHAGRAVGDAFFSDSFLT